MDSQFDLGAKPLARALISSAVKSIVPTTAQDTARAPITHLDLLQLGITQFAQAITDKALLLQGRSSLSSSGDLPGDAPVIIGFSLFVMLGIIQARDTKGMLFLCMFLTGETRHRH